MDITSQHIDQDKIKSTPTNKTSIVRSIKNSIAGFTSLLLLGIVSFSLIVTLVFIAEITTAGLLVSGFSQVLFG